MRRYGSEDNDRWVGFEHRDGDIVISTRSKCGTTWAQMICALLIFDQPELPAPLAEISPWLDWAVEPIERVRARLGRQQHRRIIKTHTPLDGLPLDDRVTYIVVGRHPLDVAVSLYHHSLNLDRDRMRALTGRLSASPTVPLNEWIRGWIDADAGPEMQLDTLPGLIHHLSDAWSRRAEPIVELLHYQDLINDLEASMRLLAGRLDIGVDEDRWPALVHAASFDAMRVNADDLAPDRLGVLTDRRAFFRSGQSGEGRTAFDDATLPRYALRLEDLASAELIAWLHS